jgi:hypothetical protein
MAVKQICRLGLVVASLWFAAMPWHAAYAAGEAVPQFRQVSTADVSSSMRNVRRIRFALPAITSPPLSIAMRPAS